MRRREPLVLALVATLTVACLGPAAAPSPNAAPATLPPAVEPTAPPAAAESVAAAPTAGSTAPPEPAAAPALPLPSSASLEVPEVVAGPPPRIGTLAWNATHAPRASSLPGFALRGVLDGHPIEPRHVVLAYQWVRDAWYIAFLRDTPASPCDFRWSREPGFYVRLRAERSPAGDSITRVEHGETVEMVDTEPDLTGAADIYPDGLDHPTYRTASAGAVSIVLDAVTDGEVSGRVYVAGTTPDDFLAGPSTASRVRSSTRVAREAAAVWLDRGSTDPG